jgi:pantetheine-phosphate adenylyltransferase
VKVVVPGSYDPFTLGHLDVVRRASGLFGEVVVAVGVNATKDYLFTLDERVELARAACQDVPGVTVVPMSGLLVDFCQAVGVTTIVKGARSGQDFVVELGMAQMNGSLAPVETLILPAAPSWGFVSSTLIRQIARGGGDVQPFVPAVVFDYWRRTGHVNAVSAAEPD